jgi:excinuclease UvrABC nuclease subunit
MGSERRHKVAGKKSGKFNAEGIENIANDKPVVYKIKDAKGNNIYTGSAKRGRVTERLKEHLPNGKDATPGGRTVEISQKSSIADARKSEERIIRQVQPKHNKKGK